MGLVMGMLGKDGPAVLKIWNSEDRIANCRPFLPGLPWECSWHLVSIAPGRGGWKWRCAGARALQGGIGGSSVGGGESTCIDPISSG